MDDVYRDGQDPALTVRFQLDDAGERLLAWTTTPWTLPSNLALRGRRRTSSTRCVAKDGERYILAAEPAGRLRAGARGRGESAR